MDLYEVVSDAFGYYWSAFLPLWMMHNLLLSDGQEIKISLCDLNKVSFVKFQPEFWNFTQIPDPKTT